ncbi:MAG: GC-type dockerin domain-anchored protein [Planctomycetota bacterium]
MPRFTLAALATGCLAAPALAQLPQHCDGQRMLAPATPAPRAFGVRVATNGTHWIIADSAASTACPDGCTSGMVHSYEMVDGRLVLRQSLVPADIGFQDRFGVRVEIDGNRMLVAAAFTIWPGLSTRGGAFIYEHDGEEWVEVGRLRPPEGEVDPAALSVFPLRAGLHGDLAILDAADGVMAYRRDPASGEWAFDQWVRIPDGTSDRAIFGSAVEIYEDWVFIGAIRDDSPGSPQGGSVFVYRDGPTGLELVQKLVPPTGSIDASFGYAMDFDGETLAIGAHSFDRVEQAQGAVFAYKLVGDEWVLRQEILHPNPRRIHRLGMRVEVEGDVLLANYEQNPPYESDFVAVFRRHADGVWRFGGRLYPKTPLFATGFGLALALHDGYALVGAEAEKPPRQPTIGGAAYFFDLACATCPADFNTDFAVDFFDALAFFNAFEAGDLRADLDLDGALTALDFLAFEAALRAGCG